MQIKKRDINKILIIFLLMHLILWTLVPSLSNINLPLDTIEHLAWSSDLKFGYGKHPPLVAWVLRFFYEIFGSQDWAYYFLSQIFVISAFFIVWVFSKEFFKNETFSLISLLLLEGIFFYNFTTPEFNVNVCQMPFWALSVLYCWKGFKDNKLIDWLLFGFFAGLGVLSKYLFIYLLVAMDVFFVYMIYRKKIDLKCLISLIPFLLVLLPHLIWLIENNFITISYGIQRTGVGDFNFLNHIQNPLIFLIKQIGILIPFFIMASFIITKLKIKFNLKDKKLLFLLTINLIPIILMFLTSVFMGAKIRTMWMTPFYLFSGTLLVYIFQNKINLKKLNNFISAFLILFIFSPVAYLYVSISQTDKRTDYPGREIAKEVQNKWDSNFINTIDSVIGDEWHAGNLTYHLQSKPKWYSHSSAFVEKSFDDFIETIGKKGFIIVDGDCTNGISLTIGNNEICMSGKK